MAFLVLSFFITPSLSPLEFFSWSLFLEIEIPLNDLSQSGWFLAPNETIKALLLRKEVFLKAPQLTEEPLCREITSHLYDFRFTKIPYLEEKKSLLPWQGAVLWEYISSNGIKFPVIQLNPKITTGFLSPYTKEEVLAHELVHTARFAFKEPLFEEIFAYQTSPGRFRRFFGPLFLYPIEPLLFICSSLIPFVFSWMDSFEIGLILFLSFFLFFFLRLLTLQWIFQRAKKLLQKMGVSSKNCLPILIRLSDLEILKTAFRSPEKTKEYFKTQSEKEDRLKVILHSYLSCS